MNRRDRILVMLFVSGALLAGFWYMVLSPARKSASDAQASLVTAKQDFAAAKQKVASGVRAQDEFRRDRTTIVKLGRVVPETDDIPTLLTQLQALATKDHIVFHDYSISSSSGGTSATTSAVAATTPTTSSTSGGTGSTNAVAPLFPPGSVQMTGGLGRTPIQLIIKGTYSQLEHYLRSVQHFAVISAKHSSTTGRLLVVDGFGYVLSGDKANSSVKNVWLTEPNLTATLSASVYFAPPLDVPAASSATTAAPATSTATSSTGTATIGGLR